MTLPQLGRFILEEALEVKELAGTDILVFTSVMLRETGLLPGDVVELRRQNDAPGQGMLGTVGLLPGGQLSPSDKLLLGVESKALLRTKLESEPAAETTFLAAPVSRRDLPVDAVLVQDDAAGATSRSQDAVLRDLDDWFKRKGLVNAGMEYRWQGETRCMIIGNRLGGWGAVDVVKTRICFVEAWETWANAWRNYKTARDDLNRQAREARLAIDGRNKLAKVLLSRRDDIPGRFMQRAAVLVCLARTSRLLVWALETTNLLSLSEQAKTLWQRLPASAHSQTREQIAPCWTQAHADGQEDLLTGDFPVTERMSLMAAYSRITELPWVMTSSTPQPEPTPTEPLRAHLKEWTEQLRAAETRFIQAVEENMTGKRLLQETIEIPLNVEEDGMRKELDKLKLDVKETVNTVSGNLRKVFASTPADVPWHAVMRKIEAVGEAISRNWGNIQDCDLPVWWQKLYGDATIETALTNSGAFPFEHQGLSLVREFTLAGKYLVASIPFLNVAVRTDTDLQACDDIFS